MINLRELSDFFELKNFTGLFHDEPNLHLFAAGKKDDPWLNASGKSITSRDEAYQKTLFEAVERHAWHAFLPQEIVYVAVGDLGGEVLDIFQLAGFSDDLKQKNRSLFSFDSSTVFGWTKVLNLVRGQALYCPMQLLSPRYFYANVRNAERAEGEPMLRSVVSTGLSAGLTKAQATLNGLLEIIERDAFMVTYLNELVPKRINLESVLTDGNESVYDFLSRNELEGHAVQLITDMPVHAFAFLLTDRSGRGPALSVGAKAHFSPQAAIIGALEEALASRLHSRWSGLHLLKVPAGPFDQVGRKIFWSKLENLSKLHFLFSGDVIEIDEISELSTSKLYPGGTVVEQVDFLDTVFASKEGGVCSISVDIPKSIWNCGIEVVLSIAPALQPLHLNERYPYFGGERLRTVPERYGFGSERQINEIPHPFH